MFKLHTFVIVICTNIVSGSDIGPSEFPFLVSIQFNYQHICGGTILNRQWILSAAHCFADLGSVDHFTVLAGTTSLDYGGMRSNVIKVLRPEMYSRPFVNDIAVLKLAKLLRFGRFIKPVVLAKTNIEEEVYVVLSGWGYSTSSKYQGYLRRKILKTISNRLCQDYFVTELNSQHLCTFNKHKHGVYQGDSGGPIIDALTKEQVGVALGNVPDFNGYPDVYTRTSSYLKWIEVHSKEI